jgi:hypothetical protein
MLYSLKKGTMSCAAIHVHGVPRVNTSTKLDITVQRNGLYWRLETDNALFYRVQNHVNVVATFKIMAPRHEVSLMSRHASNLEEVTRTFYDDVFIPVISRRSGNTFVEKDQYRESYPSATVYQRVTDIVYGFGCVHLPIDRLDADGSIYFQHGASMTLNVGVSNSTVLFVSGRAQVDNGALTGVIDGGSCVYFSGDAPILENKPATLATLPSPVVEYGAAGILASVASYYTTNYECVQVFEDGSVLSTADRERVRTHHEETRELFDRFMQRYISYPVLAWSSLFAVHDGRWDTDFDPETMRQMMLHYRRSPSMCLRRHLFTYFDRYPADCARIPDGTYYAYVPEHTTEYTYVVTRDTAVWDGHGATPNATYAIRYRGGECVFETTLRSRLETGRWMRKPTKDFRHGNYLQRVFIGPVCVANILVSRLRRDPTSWRLRRSP